MKSAPSQFFDKLEWIVLSLASLVMMTLVLKTPVTGLANQGDYQRLTNQLGVAPVAGQPYMSYYLSYVYRTGLNHAQLDVPRNVASSPFLFHYYYVYRSSELVLARIALGLHYFLGGRSYFDIRWLGAVNALVLIAGLASIIVGCRQLPSKARIVSVILAGLAFSDVGYVLYLNSFYSEPAEIGFMLLSIGLLSCVVVVRRPMLAFVGFSITGALAVTALNEDITFAIPLALLGAIVAWRQFPPGRKRIAGLILSFVVLVAGAYEYNGILQYMARITEYNSVFVGLLLHVRDKATALKALGVSPHLAHFAGYSAFDPRSAFAAPYAQALFFSHITMGGILGFYFAHPTSLLSLLNSGAKYSFQLRVPYLGNYASRIYPPDAHFATYSPWTIIHRDLLPGRLWFVVAILGAVFIIGLASLLSNLGRARSGARNVALPELLVALPVMAGIAYIQVLASQGNNELIKHQFAFNFLFDLCLVVLVGMAVECLFRVTRTFLERKHSTSRDRVQQLISDEQFGRRDRHQLFAEHWGDGTTSSSDGQRGGEDNVYDGIERSERIALRLCTRISPLLGATSCTSGKSAGRTRSSRRYTKGTGRRNYGQVHELAPEKLVNPNLNSQSLGGKCR